MKLSLVVLLIRGWVDLYTRGMHAAARAARRDEIDDDVWCQHEEAVASGRSSRSLATEMLLRLVLGMPADLSWRLTHAKHAGIWGSGRSLSMRGFTRPVNLLCVLGGVLWLISVGAFVSDPFALGGVATVGMACGAFVLAAPAARLFSEVITWPSLRIVAVAALAITALTIVAGFVLLKIWGDVDDAWGIIDTEWTLWWGYAAFMGTMALVSVTASRTARSWVEVVGWAGAVLGAAGQAARFLAYVFWPREFGSMSGIGDSLPIPIVLFGLAWIVIGIARLWSTGEQNRPQAAL